MKIYIVEAHGGEYDYRWSRIDRAFSTKNAADKYATEQRAHFERLDDLTKDLEEYMAKWSNGTHDNLENYDSLYNETAKQFLKECGVSESEVDDVLDYSLYGDETWFKEMELE